jgi:hypothetical protein
MPRLSIALMCISFEHPPCRVTPVKETMVWPHAQFQIVQGAPPDLTSFDLAALGSKNVEE